MKDNTAAVHTQVPVDVATFLLNEKRADVQAIELRHKVTILLIPNIHLETPQHSIVRLRHDELNQEDVQQPSYKMVDAPVEENDRQASANGDAKAPRQEAAIKGITPDQPAPIVAEKTKKEPEKSSGGFLSRIISWFRGAPEPVPEVKPEKKPRSTGQRDGRRGPRNGRRDEERDNREARPPREPKEAREPKSAQPATRDEAQKPREPRRQRNEPRPERKEKEQPVVVAEAAELQTAPEGAAKAMDEGNGGASRRRGRRGGRRDRTEKSEFTGETAVAETAVAETVAAVAVAADLAEPAPSAPLPVETTAVQPDVETVVALEANDDQTGETPAAPASDATPGDLQLETPPAVIVEEPAAAPAPVVAETRFVAADIPADEAVATSTPAEETPAPIAAPPAPPLAEEAIDIDKALETSGLVMIETSSERTQEWQPETVEEPAPRPRRRRAAPAAAAEEPLVMVETRQP